MALHPRPTRLAVRPHLPRRTVRLRLTLLYGGLFLIAGAGLLAITYVLVQNATAGGFSYSGANGNVGLSVAMAGSDGGGSRGRPAGSQQLDGSPGSRTRTRILTPEQAHALLRQVQALGARQHADELHQLLAYSGVALAIMAAPSPPLGWGLSARAPPPLRPPTTAAPRPPATHLHPRLAPSRPHDALTGLGDGRSRLGRPPDRQPGGQRGAPQGPRRPGRVCHGEAGPPRRPVGEKHGARRASGGR